MDKAVSRLLVTPLPPAPGVASGADEAEYDKQIREIVKTLGTVPAKQLLLTIDGKLLLDTLDPATNSITYLYTLQAKINAEKTRDTVSISAAVRKYIETFVKHFDPVQVRYAGYQFRALLEDLISFADSTIPNYVDTDAVSSKGAASESSTEAEAALNLVQDAMLRLDPETSTFTSVHLSLVSVCLCKRLYQSCIRILDNDIFHFPLRTETNRHVPRPCAPARQQHLSSSTFITSASGFSRELSYRDTLQYFLMGGTVYLAQRNWARAFLLFELAIANPIASGSNTVSMIQVEAYKRWLLVSMLDTGRPRPHSLPRTTGQQVTKLLSSLSKPYGALATAFNERSPKKLLEEYHAGVEDGIWEQDGNHGLVRLVVQSHRRNQIQAFGRIYASISLTELAKQVAEQQEGKPEDVSAVEREIREIINNKGIDAVLTTSGSGDSGTASLAAAAAAATVRFNSADGQIPLSEAQQAVRLQKAGVDVERLNIHVKDAQRRLELSKEYVLAAQRKRIKDESARNSGIGSSGVGADDSQLGMPGSLEEDMLADL